MMLSGTVRNSLFAILGLFSTSVALGDGQLVDMSKLDQQQRISGDSPALQSTPQPPVVQAVLTPVGVLDDFNRADGPLGANWAVQEGTASILSNAARAGGFGAATFVGGQASVLEADIDVISSSDDYVALILDYADNDNNLYLKVQQQDDGGTFDHAACYYGNNGSSFGPGFFSLSAPFSTAHMRVERMNTTVTITFTDIDGGGGSQQYVCTDAPLTGGTGIGIGGWDETATIDNFAGGASQMIPVPTYTSIGYILTCLLLIATGFGYLRLRTRRS